VQQNSFGAALMDDITILDSAGLAAKWAVPETWVREYTRDRATDPIPHYKLGRYVRFRFGSKELNDWFERHFRD
jgi:hypothetical protein